MSHETATIRVLGNGLQSCRFFWALCNKIMMILSMLGFGLLCMKRLRHIISDPKICHGKPVFKGTRVLVSDVLDLLAAGKSAEEILQEFPQLNEEMVMEALEYAAMLVKREHVIEASA